MTDEVKSLEMEEVELEIPKTQTPSSKNTMNDNVVVPMKQTAKKAKTTIGSSIVRMMDTSEHCAGYMCKLFACVFCSTICCGLWIAFMYAIPIASIVIGAVFLDECTIQRFIPIYLIVFGAVGASVALANTIQQIFHSYEIKEEYHFMWVARWALHPQGTILGLFIFAWFIAGSVWIYGAHGSVDLDNAASPDYCQITLYLYAFWIQTVIYIILAVLLLISISLFIIMCCTDRMRNTDDTEDDGDDDTPTEITTVTSEA